MRTVLLLALLVSALRSNAQMFLEHTYDSAATYNFCAGASGQLMIIKFEVSGERYVRINRCGKNMNIYNMSHNLVKSISLAGLPQTYNNNVGTILYLSEKLFNSDNQFEFMYMYEMSLGGCGSFVTNIYNENLNLLFTDTAGPWIQPNIHLQQYPIYNTSAGTKMILTCPNCPAKNKGKAKVFSLPGTFTTALKEANLQLMQDDMAFRAYPNPTSGNTQIDFTLPDGEEKGVIVIYDMQGKEVNRFNIDNSSGPANLSTSDLPAGTYYYQLQSVGKNSGGKKIVVVK